MAHLFPENFTSEDVLGRNQPQPKTLACMTDIFLYCDGLGVGDEET